MDDNSYEDGAIVWVKLGTCWWPGEVCVESRLPEDLIASIKKRPIAVVRFFGETTYECVKNVNNICEYNGPRKDEFIKKGLTLFRNNQKYMEKFPIDVSHAERLTDGDIDIISSEKFSPVKKTSSYSNIFGETSTRKSKKGRSLGRKSSNRQPVKAKTRLTKTPPMNINFRPAVNQNVYKCHLCAYSANRCNVLILHMKTHTINNSPPSKGNDITTNQTPSLYTSHDDGNHQETFDEIEKSLRLKLQLQPSQDDSISDDSVITAPPKKRKPKKPGLKHDILADWSEDDDDDEDEPTDDTKSETTTSEATVVVETEISTSESIDSKGSETIQNSVECQGGFLVPDKTVTAPKYRNIPKKDRRDIILKEFNNGEVFNPCEQTDKPDHVNVAIAQLSTEITDAEDAVEEAVEKSIEMEISPVSVEEILCNTIEENITNVDESVIETSIEYVNETITESSQSTSQEMLIVVENEDELKTSTPEKSKEPEKVKTISYFDFKEDDEEEDFLSSLSKLKMKYMSPDKNKESDMEKKETSSLDQKKIETEQRDEQLTTDIENLLNTTKLSNIQIDSVVTTPELSREVRALPPKERGKRIFKSRNRSVTSETVLGETKIVTPPIAEGSSQLIIVDVNSSLPKVDSSILENDAVIGNNEISFDNAVANSENRVEEESLPIQTAIIIENDEEIKERSYTIEEHPKAWNDATELLSVDNNLRADEEPVTGNLDETVETQSEICQVQDVTETEISDIVSKSLDFHEEQCIEGEIVEDQITDIVDNGEEGLTEELQITDGCEEVQIDQTEEPSNVEAEIADIVGDCYEITEDGQCHTETIDANDSEIVIEIASGQEEEQEIVEIDTDNLDDSFEREAHSLQIIEADHTDMIIYNDELDMDAIEADIVENGEECYVECEEEIVLEINTQNVNEEQELYIQDTVVPSETENELIILNDNFSQLNESEMPEEHTTVEPIATECDSGEDNESVDSTAVELSDGNADQVLTENEAELSVLAVAETLISIPSKLCEENRTALARSIEFERERRLDDANIYVMQQQEEEEVFKIDTQPARNDYSVDDEKISEKAINRTIEKLKTKEPNKPKSGSFANIEHEEENPNNERVLIEESDDSIPLDKLFATKKTKGMRSRKGSNHSYDGILEDRVIKKQVVAQTAIDEEDSLPSDTIHLRKSTRQQTRRSLDNFWALENQTADLVFPQRIGLRRSTRQKSRISFDNSLENEKSYEESIMKFYGNLAHDNNAEESQNETAEAGGETSTSFEAEKSSTDDSSPQMVAEISPVQVEVVQKDDNSINLVELEKITEEHKEKQDTDIQFPIASTDAPHVSKQSKLKKEKLRKTQNHSNQKTAENPEHDVVGNESGHNSIEIQQKVEVIEIEKSELQPDLVASTEDIAHNASDQGLLKKIKLRKSSSNSTQRPKYDIIEKEQNNTIEVVQKDDGNINVVSEDPKQEKSDPIQTKQNVEELKYIGRDSIEERKNTQRNIPTALKPKRRNSRKVTDDVIDVIDIQKNVEEVGCQLNIVEDKAESNLDKVEKKFVDDTKTKEVRLKKVLRYSHESDKIAEEHKPQQDFGANEPEETHHIEEPNRIIEKNKKHQPQKDVAEIQVENVQDVLEVPQGNKKSMRRKSRHSLSPVREQQVTIEKELEQANNEIDDQRKDKSVIKKSNSKRKRSSKDFQDHSIEVQKNVEEAIPQQNVIEEEVKQPEQKYDNIETQQKDEGDMERDKSKRKRSKKGLRNSNEKNIDEDILQKDVIEKVVEKAETDIAQQIKECNVDSTKSHHSIEVKEQKPEQDVLDKVQEQAESEPYYTEIHQKAEAAVEDDTSKRNRTRLSKKCNQSEQSLIEQEPEETEYKLSDFVTLQKEETAVEHKKSKRKRSRKGLRHSDEKVDESKQVVIEKEPEQLGIKLDDFEARPKDNDTIDPEFSKRKRLRTGSHQSAEVEKNEEQSQQDVTVSEQKEDNSHYKQIAKDQVQSESIDHKKSKRKGSKKGSTHSIETQLSKPEDDKYLEVELRSDKLIIRKTKRKSDSSIEAGKENDDDCKDDEISDDKLPQFEIVYCQQQTDESPPDDKSLEIDESDDSLPLDRLVKRILRNRQLAENLVKADNVDKENALDENMDAVVHTEERQSDEKTNREIDNREEEASSTDNAFPKESNECKTGRTFGNLNDEQEKSKSDDKVDNTVDINNVAKITDNSAKLDANTDECKSGKFVEMSNNNKRIDTSICCDEVAIAEGIVRSEALPAIISVIETENQYSKHLGQDKLEEKIEVEVKQDASENPDQILNIEKEEKMSKGDKIKLNTKLIDRIIDVEMTDENKLLQCNAATKDETMKADQATNETKDEAETINKIVDVEVKDDETKIKPNDKSITAENNCVITRKRRSHMKITPRKRIFQQPVKLEIPPQSNLEPPAQQCLQKSPQQIVQIPFPQSVEILPQQSSLVPTQHPHVEILTQEIVPNSGLSSTVSTQQNIKLPSQIVDIPFQQSVDILPQPSMQFSCNQSADALSVGSKEIETNKTAIITKLEPSEGSIAAEEVPKYDVKLEEKSSLTETPMETEQNELATVLGELDVNLVVEKQNSQSGESEKLTIKLEDVKPAPKVDDQKLAPIVEVEKVVPVAETEKLAPIVEEQQQAPEEKLTTPAQQPPPIVALQEEKFHSSVTLNSFQINDLQFDTPYEHVTPKNTRSRKGSTRGRGRKSTSPEKHEIQAFQSPAFENKQIIDSSIINKPATQYDSVQMQSSTEIPENQTSEMNILEPTIFDPANNDLVIPESPQPQKRTNRRLSKFKEQSQKPAAPLSEDIQERIKIYSFDDHIDNIVELPKRGGFSAAKESKTTAEIKSHLISNNTITIMPVPDVCSSDIPKPEKSRKSTNARYKTETQAVQEIPKISRSKRSKTVPQHAQYISDVCIPEYTKPDRLRRTTATTASYYENPTDICINKIPRPERSKRPQPLHSGYEKMIVCDNSKYDQNSHKKRKPTIEDDIPSFIIDKCSPTVVQDFPPPQKLAKIETPPMPDYNSTQSKNRSKATASLSTQVIPCSENIFDISNMPILMTTDSAFMSTSLEKMQGISSANESIASNEVTVKQSSKATPARGRKKGKQQQTITQPQTHNLAYENLPPPPPLQMNPHQVLGGGKQIGIDGKGNKFVIIKSGNSSKMIIQPDIPKISTSPPPIQHSQLSSYIPNEQPKRHPTPAEKKGNVISSQTILSNITGSQLVVPKGQIIQACVGGQIVITSKGTVITTNSPSTTVTSRSYSTMQLSNAAVTQASELLSNITTCISSSSSSPADQPKQQRQSRQPVITPSSLSQNLATVEIQLAEASSSGHPSTSGIIRRDVVKMSQRKLTEMKRLGYIEQKPIGKVLTADGFQEFHNTNEHIIPVRLPVRNQKSTTDDTSSPTDIPPLASFNDGQSTQKKSTKKKPILNPKENIVPVTIPVQQKPVGLGKNFVAISIPHAQLELLKHGNLLAVPGETFGGPRYSFYVCTVADNEAGYLPVDSQPLFLDANNQLVPKRLLTTPPEFSNRPVEIVLDPQQQMQLEQHLKQQEQQKQEQLLQEQQYQQEQLQLKLHQEQLKLQQEQQLKLQQEQLKLQQEQQLKLEQERQLKLEQERQLKLEQERQLRLQQERQIKLEQERQLKMEQERQMKLQQERQMKLQQEQQKLLQEKHIQQQILQQEQEQQLQLQHEQQMQQEQEQLQQQLQHEQQLQLEQQQISIEHEEGEQIIADHTFVINTAEGHQIILDYPSLVSLASSANEGGAHLVTPEGQTLILSPDFLAAIGAGVDQSIEIGQQYLLTETLEGHMEEHNHDILAAALAGTEVYQQDQQLIGDVLQIETTDGIQLVEQTIGFQSINHHPAPAQTNETNAIQPPIMSALEIPSNKGELIVVNKSNETGLIGQNLDDSLAVIGVTTQSSIVPSSLELPITVTNPAIASKTVTPISLSGIYTAGSVITGNDQELAYELFTSSNSMVSQNHSHIFSSNSFKNNDNTIQIQSGTDDTCLNEIILQSVSNSSSSGNVIHQQSAGDYIIGAEQTCNEFTVVQNQSDSDPIVYDDPAR